MSFSRDYDTSSPVDHTLNSSWPGKDRSIKVDVADRLSAIISGFVSGETVKGVLALPFIAVSKPSTITDQIQLYGKVVSTKTELHAVDEDGNEIQITNAGALNAVNLSGDQTVAGIKTFSSFPVTPSSAPTTDYQVANKLYADTAIKPYLLYSNTQSSGTGGGTATAGSWAQIPLNTEDLDSSGIGSLSGGQITLPAGTYKVSCKAPFYLTSLSQSRLYNITDSAVIRLGSNVYAKNTSGEASPSSFIDYVFTISGTTTIELQYQVSTTFSTSGLGVANSFGAEVYAQVFLEKLA